MTKLIKSTAAKALLLFVLFSVICGMIYPLVVTGISQLLFPEQANGSIIEVDGKKYGSALLAQQFTGEEYLWGRVMNVDTSTYVDDNGHALMYAAPSNLSPASEAYEALIAKRVEAIRLAHPEKADQPIPVELVTCSGSGLDPHISPSAAAYQIERISKNRGIESAQVEEIVVKCTDRRFLGVFGEETVNVLKVNLMLDGILK